MNREAYFTPDSIDIQANQFLNQVSKYRSRHKIDLAPKTSALLVLDMQNYFLEETSHAFIPSAVAIVDRIQSLLDVYSKSRLPIIFTRHLNNPQNAGLMASWWRDMIDVGDTASEITSELNSSLGRVLVKSQYDAFHQTGLENELRNLDVQQLVICGVMTHLCCETSARAAFMHGFEVFFTIDGTATYHRSFHEATLLNLSHGFVRPVLVQEILDGIKVYDGER